MNQTTQCPVCRHQFSGEPLLYRHVSRNHPTEATKVRRPPGSPSREELNAMVSILEGTPARRAEPSTPSSLSSESSTGSTDPPTYTTHQPAKAAGTSFGKYLTTFEVQYASQRLTDIPTYHPFQSQSEWEFAEWIMKSGVSQQDTDRLLKSRMYSELREKSSAFNTFHDNRSFLKTIDSLPELGQAKWRHIEITVDGNVTGPDGRLMSETVELWMRDPVECVAELIGNPTFRDAMHYTPIQEMAVDNDGIGEEPDRFFEEMWSGDWWWQVQDALPADSTVAPIILASDKTQLSTFSGDKQAWPVYLTIGNINKSLRRRPSQRAMVLLGYLPVTKLHCFQLQDRSNQGHRLFHRAMRHVLQPLARAGTGGVFMTCADGNIRRVHPILASYIADYPEQCLMDNVEEYEEYEAQGLRDVPEPFWEELPLVNIYRCMTPDMLHQLHKGVFKDHLFKWCTSRKKDEVDARFTRLPPFNGLRHFSKGISTISQFTGNEHREMEKVFIGIMINLHDEDPDIVRAARSLLDFIYLAHYPSHSTSTLQQMKEAINSFNASKGVFIRTGLREHFNIGKIHSLAHYVPSIIDYGALDAYNSEISERLHIDFAKLGYRSSNRKAYQKQMVTWLERQEKINTFARYQDWVAALHHRPASPSLTPNFPERMSTLCHDSEHCEGEEQQGDEDEPEEAVNQELPVTHGHQTTALNHGASTSGMAASAERLSHVPLPTTCADPDAEETMFGPYQVSKKPSLGYWSADKIASFTGAVGFEAELRAFLKRENSVIPASVLALIGEYEYGMYRQFKRTLPSLRGLSDDGYTDRVQARPATSKAPARFDTVLWVEDPDRAENIGVGVYRSRLLTAPASAKDIEWARSALYSHFLLPFNVLGQAQRHPKDF
ncbi:hypothetical protein FS837_003250 [Tulasnella sp. UAMH 9824]|nr:hypothetical protein FS837_003250 [Tulasnella sp. UAMH 9824]